MIRGHVGTNREARLTVEIAGASGMAQPVEFVLDAEFNGWLTLSQDMIDRVGLTSARPQSGILADGQRVEFRTFTASAWWHGQRRNVEIVESPGDPLLGISMLWGSNVTLQAWKGGFNHRGS